MMCKCNIDWPYEMPAFAGMTRLQQFYVTLKKTEITNLGCKLLESFRTFQKLWGPMLSALQHQNCILINPLKSYSFIGFARQVGGVVLTEPVARSVN
jgi:hypothetical protein